MKILMLHGLLLYNNSLKYTKYVVKTEAMLLELMLLLSDQSRYTNSNI